MHIEKKVIRTIVSYVHVCMMPMYSLHVSPSYITSGTQFLMEVRGETGLPLLHRSNTSMAMSIGA